LSSPVPPYVDSGHGIVGMIVLSGIKMGNCWGGVVGDVPLKHVSEHLPGDIVVELFNLLLNVAKEGIAGPLADHHDEEDGTFSEEHRHCCARADGVSADLVCCNVE
jgi:hypothetical protein